MQSANRCSIRPSIHAKGRMIERGISKNELLENISAGAKRAVGSRIISSFRGMDTVYRQMPCNYCIIMLYWKR